MNVTIADLLNTTKGLTITGLRRVNTVTPIWVVTIVYQNGRLGGVSFIADDETQDSLSFKIGPTGLVIEVAEEKTVA